MQTVFAAEATVDVQKRLEDARKAFPIEMSPVSLGFEVTEEAARCGMPLRPRWDFGMSPEKLHWRETKAFQRWLETVRGAFQRRGGQLPVFEMNLQVWRQVWGDYARYVREPVHCSCGGC